MFHGGTNFGLTSGANDKGTYGPSSPATTTTRRWTRPGTRPRSTGRSVRCSPGTTPVPADRPAGRGARRRPSTVRRSRRSLPLWRRAGAARGVAVGLTSLSAPTTSARPRGSRCTRRPSTCPGQPCSSVGEVRDRAQVFLNRQPVGVLARDHHDRALPLPSGARGTLELLVEDQGRVNYGPRIGEQKGLIGPVTVGGAPVRGWQVLPLPLADVTPAVAALRALPAVPVTSLAGPVFARGSSTCRVTRRLTCSSPGRAGQRHRLAQRVLPWPVLVARPAADAVRAGTGHQERGERAGPPGAGRDGRRHAAVRGRARSRAHRVLSTECLRLPSASPGSATGAS